MRKRNALTHISVCNKHDRFYFARDKKKEVWQLIEHSSKRIRGEMRKVSVCKNDSGEMRVFMSSRMIVFIANIYNQSTVNTIALQTKLL